MGTVNLLGSLMVAQGNALRRGRRLRQTVGKGCHRLHVSGVSPKSMAAMNEAAKDGFFWFRSTGISHLSCELAIIKSLGFIGGQPD
uniref:Uncharacterized protein n=1 Tax=Arundo donax TaxID=35708 RepID=A0A0A9EWB8_ARUDO